MSDLVFIGKTDFNASDYSNPATVSLEIEWFADEDQQGQVVEANRHSGDAPGRSSQSRSWK